MCMPGTDLGERGELVQRAALLAVVSLAAEGAKFTAPTSLSVARQGATVLDRVSRLANRARDDRALPVSNVGRDRKLDLAIAGLRETLRAQSLGGGNGLLRLRIASTSERDQLTLALVGGKRHFDLTVTGASKLSHAQLLGRGRNLCRLRVAGGGEGHKLTMRMVGGKSNLDLGVAGAGELAHASLLGDGRDLQRPQRCEQRRRPPARGSRYRLRGRR